MYPRTSRWPQPWCRSAVKRLKGSTYQILTCASLWKSQREMFLRRNWSHPRGQTVAHRCPAQPLPWRSCDFSCGGTVLAGSDPAFFEVFLLELEQGLDNLNAKSSHLNLRGGLGGSLKTCQLINKINLNLWSRVYCWKYFDRHFFGCQLVKSLASAFFEAIFSIVPSRFGFSRWSRPKGPKEAEAKSS